MNKIIRALRKLLKVNSPSKQWMNVKEVDNNEFV